MKEAETKSQVQGLIVMIPMIPIFMATPILMAPDALWVRIISLIFFDARCDAAANWHDRNSDLGAGSDAEPLGIFCCIDRLFVSQNF